MTAMPNKTVTLEVDDGVATLTLERPDQLNAMTAALMDDITTAVGAVDADTEVRVLVITGRGRGFCSGADLGDGGLFGGAERSGGPTALMDRHFHPAIRAVAACRVPTISRINGAVAGGGIGLALATDIALAARSAFFVATFGPRLGIVPDLGTTWHLANKAGRGRAMGLAMLGDRFSADEAEEWGLIYRAVDDDELDAEVARATAILTRSSNEAMLRIRSAIGDAPDHSLGEQLDVERDHQSVLIPMNMIEGATAFVEGRDPDFRASPS